MNQPIAIYSSWRRTIPQIIVAALLTITMLAISPESKRVMAMIAALGIYFAYMFISRYFIASSHRRGMIALGNDEFETSLYEFEKSFECFTKHKGIDHWRGLIFLSPSIWSYREMALMNIGAVYSQQNDVEKYRRATERLLREYPNNIRGQNAIEFLDAVVKQNNEDE